ncbi:MAG: hypothetical protein ABJ370_12095 [Paracoccaceae bacterium]
MRIGPMECAAHCTGGRKSRRMSFATPQYTNDGNIALQSGINTATTVTSNPQRNPTKNT